MPHRRNGTIRTRTPAAAHSLSRRYRLALIGAPLALGLVATACSTTKLNGAAAVPPAPAVTTPPSTAPPVFPLTGLPVDNSQRAGRPALSVKIDNAPPARAQAGLNNADIVAEALVEGGLTRLLATFQSKDASLVGPIRSARPADAALLRELGGGIFAYSGAAAGEIAPVKASSDATLIYFDSGDPAFHRVSWRVTPANVFSSTDALYGSGYAHGAKTAPPPQLFTYSSTPAAGTPATSAYMDFSSFSSAGWTWDPASGTYQRTQNGTPDTLTDGSRVDASNVVVMSVAIGHTGIFDAAHNEDPLVILTGSGTAWVMRDGKVIQGTWQRPSITDPVQLLDASGKQIALHPGRTWMELLPRPFSPRIS
ncbi:MAG TPA: DUF3048 domain-containing protein [Acidimicrobiales bacterium]|nr:DUF3048 domain-containing protein [Acidimicrobiales bacterium]